MTKQERIFFFLALVALVTVIVWEMKNRRPPGGGAVAADGAPAVIDLAPGDSAVPGVNADFQNAPMYLSYNMPWLFNPALQGVLPVVSAGQVAQVAEQPSNPLAYH
jgi:hypothetical protein